MSRKTYKVKFTAKNSSGEQILFFDLDSPDFEDDECSMTLVGDYEGKDIQIDFDVIKKSDFKKTLEFLLENLE